MGLARPGNLLEGRGGWPSFKFGPPCLVPLSDVPAYSLLSLGFLGFLGVQSCQECVLSLGRGLGGGGLRAWAVVIEGVAFVPTTFLSSGMCHSSDALCLDIFNKGYNCFVGSGG